MKKERDCNKVEINLHDVDFAKIGRVGNKVLDLLARKIKNPLHGYLLLKSLCFVFEDSLGCHLEPEDKHELKKMIVEESEDFEV